MTRELQTTVKTLGDILPGADLPVSMIRTPVSGLSIDSRAIEFGDVFVAVQGICEHGSQYIESAIENGATAIFQESPDEHYSVKTDLVVPVIFIPNLENNLSGIAGNFYNHPTSHVPVIAVTGTNGKTTVSQLYAQLAALSDIDCGVVGTMGYGVCRKVTVSEECLEDDSQRGVTAKTELHSTGMTTPDPIRAQKICDDLLLNGSRQIVMEVSSHGLQQNRVSSMCIDTAIFTNLTHDHLDYHGTMEAYGKAKAKLFAMSSVKTAVINIDDAFGEQLYKAISKDKNVLSYSIKKKANIYLEDMTFSGGMTHANLIIKDQKFTLSTALVGDFNLSNLLAVFSAFYVHSETLFLDAYSIVNNIVSLQPVCGRMESIENKVDRHVVIDYAHTPDALANVLRSLKTLVSGQLICVFGCGGDRDKEKRPLMAEVAESLADIIIVTSDNPRTESPESIIADVCQGFKNSKPIIISDREQAIKQAIERSNAGDTLLIAGKGHEDYQLIGTQKLPFLDQQVARLALRKMEESL